MPITATSPRIISLRFISNKFPRLLAEREIIANASILVRISPRTDGKDSNYFWENKNSVGKVVKKYLTWENDKWQMTVLKMNDSGCVCDYLFYY